MELENLYANCMLAVVMPELLERIASITHGDLPHSEVVLSALMRKLSALLIPNERDFGTFCRDTCLQIRLTSLQ